MYGLNIPKKHIIASFFVLLMVVVLPLVIILVQKRQDIRPRALQGNANLLLSVDKNSPGEKEEIHVMATVQLTNTTLLISGADITILYDKAKLEAVSVVPAIGSSDAFTEAPIVTKEGSFDSTYNFLRVAEVANKAAGLLKSNSAKLADITFRTKVAGQAVIKYADDNNLLQIVGTSTP